jgi:hypothetical protein
MTKLRNIDPGEKSAGNRWRLGKTGARTPSNRTRTHSEQLSPIKPNFCIRPTPSHDLRRINQSRSHIYQVLL